jgi:hypothetical protein
VTLAALCVANDLDMHAAGEIELARISVPETAAKIRAKQAAKPKHSPLPECAPSSDQFAHDRNMVAQPDERAAFECVFRKPNSVDRTESGYAVSRDADWRGGLDREDARRFIDRWIGWKAARASAQGNHPPIDGDRQGESS